MSRIAVWGVLSSGLALGLFASCGSSVNTAGAGQGGAGAGTIGAGGNLFGTGGGSTACNSNQDCKMGVCTQGACCATAALGCAGKCCHIGDVCLFDACVTPGAPCVSQQDCPQGSYCEPSLGGPGKPPMGPGCTEPITTGKCLPLPPLCSAPNADPNHCIEDCQYHPMGGQLNAVQKWQWGYAPKPTEFPDHADIWATPIVGRLYDANCDGKVDIADPPDIVFVAGNAKSTCCQCTGDTPNACRTGVLRMLDGKNGKEIWSLDKAEPKSAGFAGASVAIGDIDGDQLVDIAALTGEGKIAMISNTGKVLRVSDKPVDSVADGLFGWGGGVALGDMDGDGFPEIAYGHNLFSTTGGAITLLWSGNGGNGGNEGFGVAGTALSYFEDLDGDGKLELVAGNTAYRKDGSKLWKSPLPDGFTATADFDKDGKPEVVLVSSGQLRILDGATGALLLGPATIPGVGSGGPPTVADFVGDGSRAISVAMATSIAVMKPDFAKKTIAVLWTAKTHDISSSVTGASVFDFEGAGHPSVVYNDECWLWVYDGATGNVRFTTSTQSFTATEASIVADVDGDGHAELVMIANGSDPSDAGWHCRHHNTGMDGYPIWHAAPGNVYYRGITVFGDAASSWVGTRTEWNQHAYSVVNFCDPRDGACDANDFYGQLPPQQKANWNLPWLNDFRQNVEDKGLFDAPDPTPTLVADCIDPVPFTVSVRNVGLAGLPQGVEVGVFKEAKPEVMVASAKTDKVLLAGQVETFSLTGNNMASSHDTFVARIIIDPNNPTFHECNNNNNQSKPVTPQCAN